MRLIHSGETMKPRLKLFTLSIVLVTGFAVAFAVTQSTPSPSVSTASILPSLDTGGGLAKGEVLAGTRNGLFRISIANGAVTTVLSGGEIREILRPNSGKVGWFFLGSRGVIHSDDLISFDERNDGLPFKTYKDVVDGKKVFRREVTDLKDLASDASGDRLVTCTKDEVWYSGDAGRSWTDLGSPSFITGLKCVALAPFPGTDKPAVWASHPIKGLFVREIRPKSPWVPVTKGLYTMPTMTSPDEIADLVWVPAKAKALDTPPKSAPATPAGTLWASNSFEEKIFRSDLSAPDFSLAWDNGKDFGIAESLDPMADGSLRFVKEGAVMRLQTDGTVSEDVEATNLVRQAISDAGDSTLMALAWNEGSSTPGLSELWLLLPDPDKNIRHEAAGKNALYLQAGYVIDSASREKNFDILARHGLNAFVIDLKDDAGRLRFSPRDPLIRSFAKVANPIDIESLAAEAKLKGVWLIARIPVFKDGVMAGAEGGKFAVWDGPHNAPWQGMKTVKDDIAPPSGFDFQQPPIPGVVEAPSSTQKIDPPSATKRVPNGERWVDPYSEEVWAYNVAIANEAVARGFDEVQFDYIRFPTDGDNVDDATFRWEDPGMDRESAITSFLAFARERVKAPISIDIYGANGWYRSGARTGQDVETLARYVDVICPMFYPSHFEQGFLGQEPAVQRPWRIYRLGSLRTARIARDRVIVRPYVQAFYMGVSYDKIWYNPDYVAREVIGVIQGENLGMTFWNNVDRYDDIPYLSKSSDGTLIVRSASAASGAPYEAQATTPSTTAPPAAASTAMPTASAASQASAAAVPASVSAGPTATGSSATKPGGATVGQSATAPIDPPAPVVPPSTNPPVSSDDGILN